MVKISIIVPIYNVEQYLKRCIDSILNQTFTEFELILVNDGSRDRSGDIIDEYEKLDDRIKVIHKPNGGLSDARNIGLDIATGDYIGFVDSDDYISLDMYEKLYNACIENNSEIAMCGRYMVNEMTVKTLFTLDNQEVWSSKKAIGKILTWDNIDSSACDKLFNVKLFSNKRFPVGKYNEDIFIIPQIISETEKIVHIGEPKYYYYNRPGSITTEEFTEKKLDLLDANSKVVNLVIAKYPDLIIKAESFYLKGIIYLVGLIQKSPYKKKYNNYHGILMNQLSKNIKKILKNPYIPYQQKLLAFLIQARLYAIIIKFKVIIRTVVKL